MKHIQAKDLVGKVTDIHAHVGINIKAYARTEFPYCQSIEGLYYRQKANGVDYNVVFTSSTDLYFDIPTLVKEGKMVPSKQPIFNAPYEQENKMLFTEIFRFCPEYKDRFLPFVIVDPVRKIPEQMRALQALAEEYPIYGIKVVPIGCQSKVTGLLEDGEALLDYAKQLDLPLLFHVTVHPEEEFSQVSDTFIIIDRYPELRFCLAHCVGLSRKFLERADATPNVWVDTSALKIQVQATYENYAFMASPSERYDWDYSDHAQIMRELMENFPNTIIWGTDSPAYSYIARRLQGTGSYIDFRLKGNYEDEKGALDALPTDKKQKACSTNSIAFLFGKQ